MSGGLVACLWVWTSVGALAAEHHGDNTPADPVEYSVASALSSVVDMPPGAKDPAAASAEIPRPGRDSRPALLARPRKGHASPSPSPDASPDSSPGVTANQGGTPAPNVSPSPEFTEKYEAAYTKFLEKNYPDALSLLDEADKIQPGQPQSISLRFKSHYALAYISYRKQDYPAALGELDKADQTQKNADSYNLRGLIFSKQHNYDQAEAMFHKSIVTDPALWAAKFNYAELPFNRGDYMSARTRFEELFSQTDASKQPREAELTQYKVFLTLLLEGKVEAASTFMDHLNFSGATPARYFCNAALNFRAGSVDRAKNWIDDAKKEYPPQLVAIFIESFYRLGWMADPNAPPGTMVAQVTPVGTPAATTSGTPPIMVATATAAPSVLPSATAVAALPTPIIVAAASPTPTPFPTPVLIKPSPAIAFASPTPRSTVSPTPALVVVTASPTPTAVAVATPRATVSASPAVVVATPTPRPSATATPVVAVATPTATAAPTRPTLAAASVSPTPAATAPPVIAAVTPARSVTPSPRPAASAPAVVLVPTPAVTPTRPLALASATPTPVRTQITPAPSATPATAAQAASDRQVRHKRDVHIALLVLVLGQAIFYFIAMRGMLLRRRQKEMRAAARRRATLESSK